jgi:hypothetical protein
MTRISNAAPGDRAADRPHADDDHRIAGQLAHRAAPAAAPFMPPLRVVERDELAREAEEHREGVLGDAAPVRAAHVRHRHVALHEVLNRGHRLDTGAAGMHPAQGRPCRLEGARVDPAQIRVRVAHLYPLVLHARGADERDLREFLRERQERCILWPRANDDLHHVALLPIVHPATATRMLLCRPPCCAPHHASVCPRLATTSSASLHR